MFKAPNTDDEADNDDPDAPSLIPDGPDDVQDDHEEDEMMPDIITMDDPLNDETEENLENEGDFLAAESCGVKRESLEEDDDEEADAEAAAAVIPSGSRKRKISEDSG